VRNAGMLFSSSFGIVLSHKGCLVCEPDLFERASETFAEPE